MKVLRERATQRIYSRDAPWQADFQAKRAAELAEFHETPPSAIRLCSSTAAAGRAARRETAAADGAQAQAPVPQSLPLPDEEDDEYL